MRLLLCFLVCFNAYGVTPIKTGEKSPHDGYVFTNEEEQKLRQRDFEQVTKIQSLSQLNVINKEIIANKDLQIDHNTKYQKQLTDELAKKPTGFWEKTGYFVLGATITGLISYGTIKALK